MTGEGFAIRHKPIDLTLRRPLETGHGPITHRRGFGLEVTSDGTSGYGEAMTLPGWTETRAGSLDHLRTISEYIEMGEIAMALARARPTPALRHAFVQALWDWRARNASMSITEWAIDEPPETVAVNGVVGATEPAETASAVSEVFEAGFSTVKLKVGTSTLANDRQRIEEALTAVPSNGTLRVDANGGWSRETAGEIQRTFAGSPIEYLEQPVPARDTTGLAQLAGGKIPIAADESLIEIPPRTLFGSVDYLILKPMVVGGLDRALAIDRLASKHGVKTTISTTIDGPLGRASGYLVAAMTGPESPAGLGPDDSFEESLPAGITTTAGRGTFQNETSGFGITWPF